ncbi:MAG: ABC transporter ATP-binding protein, partial [Oscillospiraceae bacterium]
NYGGEVFLFDKNLKSLAIPQRAKLMTIIHQSENCNFPYTCLELVLMGAYPNMGRSWKIKDETLAEVKEIMAMTDTLKFADKKINEISGGELQRVILSRALLQKPKLLLLDEAMSDMDINYKISATKLLKEIIRKESISVIGINHDLNMAYNFSDRIIALKDGVLKADGSPDSVFTESFFKEVFAVEAEIVAKKGFLIKDNIN